MTTMTQSTPEDLSNVGEDPILPLYRQWVAARDEWHRYVGLPGNEN
ncbi:hypothetical protein [Maritimibacter fusiformis]|nr:hypothetical protein [Maritimibacter fusiformis]